MPPTGDEISWWKEAIGAVGGALIAVATWSFVAGRKTQKIEQQIESIKTAQGESVASLKQEILAIVQQTMASAALRQSEQSVETRTNIAVIQALMGEMQADIQAIFERMDGHHKEVQGDIKELFKRIERRKNEIYPPPHGERRGQ